MRRMLFVWVVVVVLAGMRAYIGPASGQGDKSKRTSWRQASSAGVQRSAYRFQIARWCRWRQ
jgi:hypothetical protein